MKDSHFVMETLPFEGRNIGIWWDGVHRDGDVDQDVTLHQHEHENVVTLHEHEHGVTMHEHENGV
jgi:hypothetical protein